MVLEGRLKPILYNQVLHNDIINSVTRYFSSQELQVKRVNDYAFWIACNNNSDLKKGYLFFLFNDYTQEVSLHYTLNIKKKLLEFIESNEYSDEIVLHTLLIVHYDKRTNLERLKRYVSILLKHKGYFVIGQKDLVIENHIDLLANLDVDSLEKKRLEFNQIYKNRMLSIEDTNKLFEIYLEATNWEDEVDEYLSPNSNPYELLDDI